MANIKAQQKSIRADKRKTARNEARRGRITNLARQIRLALDAGKADEAKKLFIDYQKAVDKAAGRNVLKKNTAARKKNRVARAIKRVGTK